VKYQANDDLSFNIIKGLSFYYCTYRSDSSNGCCMV
jgi:hypothetical protein